MTEHPKKDSGAGSPHRDKEVRYLADKMGVSVEEMRRLLAESTMSPEELERELLKPALPKT